MHALAQVGAGQSFSDEPESPGGLKPGFFLIWEIQVELEKCISSKFPSSAGAAGLGTGLGEHWEGKCVRVVVKNKK